jgi:diguanylate cyclase (GGDEF)-like protein
MPQPEDDEGFDDGYSSEGELLGGLISKDDNPYVTSSAERLRKMVRSITIKVADAEIHAAVSIGVACKEADMVDADAMINAADKALYAAKRFGRDRTCLIAAGQVMPAHD